MEGGDGVTKKQAMTVERVHSGQAARQQQARMQAYRKKMMGVGRHGKR